MNETLAIVAHGPLSRLKETLRSLEAAGLRGHVLKPEDGCLNR